MYLGLLVCTCIIIAVRDHLLMFLINYHIYCIYVIIICVCIYTNYIFYLKYQYIYLLTYMYTYWFVYVNVICVYIHILFYFYGVVYNLVVLSDVTITFCILGFKKCCFWFFFLFFWVCQFFDQTYSFFREC